MFRFHLHVFFVVCPSVCPCVPILVHLNRHVDLVEKVLLDLKDSLFSFFSLFILPAYLYFPKCHCHWFFTVQEFLIIVIFLFVPNYKNMGIVRFRGKLFISGPAVVPPPPLKKLVQTVCIQICKDAKLMRPAFSVIL